MSQQRGKLSFRLKTSHRPAGTTGEIIPPKGKLQTVLTMGGNGPLCRTVNLTTSLFCFVLLLGSVSCRIPRSEGERGAARVLDRKSTRLNSSHQIISYAVFCL